jgi:hypothetical protein
MSPTEPNPPWTQYPGEASYWAGWKQGSGYVWLLSVFLPYWSSATAEQRAQYLAKWPPPDEDWRSWISEQY